MVTRRSSNRTVAISVGGCDDESLLKLGYGNEHVNETLVHIARIIFNCGCRLIYGGRLDPNYDKDPADPSNRTRALLNAASGWASAADIDEPPPEPPLISLQSWPSDELVTPAIKASLLHVCQFVQVAASEIPETIFSNDSKSWKAASSLTDMRGRMAKGCKDFPGISLLIALGGKLKGFSGVMPGVAEEYLEARKAEKPVFVSSKFGGCAGEIARYLATPDAIFPVELTFAHHQARLPRLHEELAIEKRFGALKDKLDSDRAQLRGSKPLVPGLTNKNLRQWMLTGSESELTTAIRQAVAGAMLTSPAP